MGYTYKILIFILAVFVFNTNTDAQDISKLKEKGVSENVLVSLSKAQNPEQKVDALIDACYELHELSPTLSIEIAQLALQMSETIGYDKGVLKSKNCLGVAYYLLDNYKYAIEKFNEAVIIAKKNDDVSGEASIYSNLAMVYNSLANYNKALKYNFDALELREEMVDSMGIAISYNNIGTSYHYKKEYVQALAYYQKSSVLKDKIGDKIGKASTINNIGQLFYEMYTDSSLWALDSALSYHLKAYTIRRTSENKIGTSESLMNLGNIYSEKEQYELALSSYRAALNIQKQLGDSGGVSLSLYNMGLMYLKQRDNKQALQFLHKSIDAAKFVENPDLLRDNYKMLLEIYEEQGDYAKAHFYAKKYIDINDSISDLASKSLLDEYNKKLNYVADNDQVAENTYQKGQKVLYTVFISVVVLLLIIISYLAFKYMKIAK
jgi:tetratricopeptide (TPR) repeat protein